MSERKSSRNYSAKTLKILWGRSAGRCALPDCRIELLVNATDYDPIVTIGDMAHISASSDEGPRGNDTSEIEGRDEYDNLILLCPTCHRRLDSQKNTHTIEYIKALRNEHEAWVRLNLPERGAAKTGWRVISLQGAHPVDLSLFAQAIEPDFLLESPIVLKADPTSKSWDQIQTEISELCGQLLASNSSFEFRLAVFPLAPVSACIGLGYHLTNRPRVKLFQYFRENQNWDWPESRIAVVLSRDNFPEPDVEAHNVIFCFHLSAEIQLSSVDELKLEQCKIINIRTNVPSTSFLCAESQLRELANRARESFEYSLSAFPNAHSWHILFTGPAPGAVIVGQQINPTMCPPCALYEYRRDRTPGYEKSIVLKDSNV